MSENRWGDIAPEHVAAAPGYDRTPAGPVRRAALHDTSGTLLGHVWTDDHNAAGWEPADANPETARAGAYVWKVLARAHQRGESASVITESKRYAPLYDLDDSTTGT